jgi:dTDP-4-amino-4,6-dideoxygalactose transaminase
MHIPFHRPHISDEEILAATDSLKSGWITMGKKTVEFENCFSDYLGNENSIAVNSCTAALHLSLCCANLQPGDEVIIPANTFAATAEVVHYFGAKPVLVDIEKETHLIDVNKIEEKITDKTRAIIPVHFSGQPSDMDEILEIAKKFNLFVIEDAAHSLPSSYKGKMIGTIGDATCFSFYATKTLTTGEGGMITTGNREWSEKCRRLRLHGITRDVWERQGERASWEYDIIETGYKYNTTDINSAIGIEQLKKIDKLNNKRHVIADTYSREFSGIDGLKLYRVKNDRKTCWYLYPVIIDIDALKIDRNMVVEKLKEQGVETSVHFIPIYRFSFFKEKNNNPADFPISEWVYKRTLSLPIFPDMTEDEVNYVISSIKKIIKDNKR